MEGYSSSRRKATRPRLNGFFKTEDEQLERRRSGLVVHQLEIDHLGGVALARPELYDARVSAGPLGETRCDVREEPVHESSSEARRVPAGVHAGRRACPRVIIFSAKGFTAFAFASVV